MASRLELAARPHRNKPKKATVAVDPVLVISVLEARVRSLQGKVIDHRRTLSQVMDMLQTKATPYEVCDYINRALGVDHGAK